MAVCLSCKRLVTRPVCTCLLPNDYWNRLNMVISHWFCVLSAPLLCQCLKVSAITIILHMSGLWQQETTGLNFSNFSVRNANPWHTANTVPAMSSSVAFSYHSYWRCKYKQEKKKYVAPQAKLIKWKLQKKRLNPSALCQRNQESVQDTIEFGLLIITAFLPRLFKPISEQRTEHQPHPTK